MAKKRGFMSPLGNAIGSVDAQKNASEANLKSLTRQITYEIENIGEDVVSYLQKTFGIESVGQCFLWKLASGGTARFDEVILSYDQVRDTTFVNFDVNGRDQTLLNADSLRDLDSLQFQQFYPAVGREVNGKIEVLDGSRRRAWFLLNRGIVKSFRVLITKNEISLSDAKALAKQLQTAKEHNLREIGLQCLSLQRVNPNITQSEIAIQLNISQAGVSKALKAASIDENLIKLFPVSNDLTHSDYALLNKIMKVHVNKIDLNTFLAELSMKIVIIQAEYSLQERKNAIIIAIKTELKVIEEKLKNDTLLVTALLSYDTPGVFARKRVKGRNFSYEFGRLSQDLQSELDTVIGEVLRKFKKS